MWTEGVQGFDTLPYQGIVIYPTLTISIPQRPAFPGQAVAESNRLQQLLPLSEALQAIEDAGCQAGTPMLGGLGLVGGFLEPNFCWVVAILPLVSWCILGIGLKGINLCFFLSEEMMKLVIYSAESINLQKGRWTSGACRHSWGQSGQRSFRSCDGWWSMIVDGLHFQLFKRSGLENWCITHN